MDIVIVVLDSLRLDFVGAYGNAWVRTATLDGLSAEAATLDNAYVGSYPTVPERTDLFTGRYVFPYRGWTDIPADERTLAGVLRLDHGYTTMFLGDRPGLMSVGRGFQAHEQIRGQEGDRWATAPMAVELPCAPGKLRSPRGTVVQFLRNIGGWRGEDDTFAARVLARAIQWLRDNRGAVGEALMPRGAGLGSAVQEATRAGSNHVGTQHAVSAPGLALPWIRAGTRRAVSLHPVSG